jgi:hypothetical protein
MPAKVEGNVPTGAKLMPAVGFWDVEDTLCPTKKLPKVSTMRAG